MNSLQVHDREGYMLEKLYSVRRAAKVLGGISPRTVYAWLGQGRIVRTKVGRRTMIRESELRRILGTRPTQLLDFKKRAAGDKEVTE